MREDVLQGGGTILNYQEFRRRWDAVRSSVLLLVEHTEARLKTPTEELNAATLARDFPDIPFTERIWNAWLANTKKLQGVRRRDRFPYATHPTRMALICCWLFDDQIIKENSAVLAITHDYLEEGDGISLEGVAAMQKIFPNEADACLAAIVLSEPMIDYNALGDASEFPFWRRVAYLLQTEAAIRALGNQIFANACLADKIDNLHDLSYIANDSRLTPETRSVKLNHRLGYFLFVEEAIGPLAAKELQSILAAGIQSKSTEFGLDLADAHKESQKLAIRTKAKAPQIIEMTRAYQANLGLKLI